MTNAPKEYTVLFLGETQSGKSSLVEALKKYADPDYIVNSSFIGDSCFSLTKNVISATITTDCPAHFISRKSSSGRKRVDYGKFIDRDQEDYEDKLNERKYRLERDETTTPRKIFNLIDTPGLNDTSLFDINNIAIIFRALENIDSINLVIITLANNPFTEALNAALKDYLDLLPELNVNIVFVHTKIDYIRLHPKDDTQFAKSLLEKREFLAQLAGRDFVPHILIDNNIGTKQAVRDCITQNTLRNLLCMAKLNQPTPVRTMRMNKTETMKDVDLILRDKYEARVKARLKTLGAKNRNQKNLMGYINETKGLVTTREVQLKAAKEYLRVNDNDSLELLHEELYQQDFSILNMMEGTKPMYCLGKKQTLEPGFMYHILDHLDIRIQNIKILQEAGGKGETFWAVKFRRRKRQNGIYHVRIYITRRKKFAEAIEQKKTEVRTCEGMPEDYNTDLEQFERDNREQQIEIKELLDDLKQDLYLLSRTAAIQLDNQIPFVGRCCGLCP
ncbi:hypothetical protein BG003_008011 [Podila horticola]|nr:hypothetical protein BG003_008011 [Podila horticola]